MPMMRSGMQLAAWPVWTAACLRSENLKILFHFQYLIAVHIFKAKLQFDNTKKNTFLKTCHLHSRFPREFTQFGLSLF
jgi:hypothetical protein